MLFRSGEVYFSDAVLSTLTAEELKKKLTDNVLAHNQLICDQASQVGMDMSEYERNLFLRVIDNQWMAHIDEMSDLRQNVGLYAYGQQDPLIIYKKEGREMFQAMISRIHEHIVGNLTHITEIKVKENPIERKQAGEEINASLSDGKTFKASTETIKKDKVPDRNSPCPCGSTWPDGTPKKYKDCCGKQV